LYKKLLRAAEKMPTQNRVDYVKRRTQKEFRAASLVSDPEHIDLLMTVGLTNLETVEVQAKHLTSVWGDLEDHTKAAIAKQNDQSNVKQALEDTPLPDTPQRK